MGKGGLQKISQGYHMWYGVQNMSKYDIDIKVQPLTAAEENQKRSESYYVKY